MLLVKHGEVDFSVDSAPPDRSHTPSPEAEGAVAEAGGVGGDGLELLSMRKAWRMLSAAGSFPLRVPPVVAAVAAAAAAAPPPPHTPGVAGLDERSQ